MTDDTTLVELGERRTRLRDELKALNETIEARVKIALAQGMNESQLSREAQVDRMTVRKWAGKRRESALTDPRKNLGPDVDSSHPVL